MKNCLIGVVLAVLCLVGVPRADAQSCPMGFQDSAPHTPRQTLSPVEWDSLEGSCWFAYALKITEINDDWETGIASCKVWDCWETYCLQTKADAAHEAASQAWEDYVGCLYQDNEGLPEDPECGEGKTTMPPRATPGSNIGDNIAWDNACYNHYLLECEDAYDDMVDAILLCDTELVTPGICFDAECVSEALGAYNAARGQAYTDYINCILLM